VTHANFDIDDIIIRFLAGETTSSENQSLSHWLSESSENLLYFNSLRNTWLASSQLVNPTEQTLETKSNIKKYRLFGNSLPQLLKIAAILILLIGFGVVLYTRFGAQNSSKQNFIVTVEATIGSKAVTTLPDGTKVWLNSGSKLEYNGNYNSKHREVKLVGEAYFSVVTNASMPFVVKAGKLSIKALGTIFNVKAYPEEKSIITTLVKGKVIIEGKDNENKEFKVQMKPKEAVTYFKEEIPATIAGDEIERTQQDFQSIQGKTETTEISIVKAKQVNTELFTSWKDTRWIIEKQKLEDLARDFERRYNIKIQFLSDTIKQFHFTGTIENETIEQIMVIMQHTLPIKYKIEKGMIEIGTDPYLLKNFYY
jgi:ferric-dicitrate binding protein FerR (iron transport regulator)